MSSPSDVQVLAEMQADALTIKGHPTTPLFGDNGEPMKMITVCGECGAVHSIIMLLGDRWYCSTCRKEGSVTKGRKMFPIS